MRILVTGGRGQLGLSLKKVAMNYPRHQLIFTDMPEADITQQKGIERLVQTHGVELIINCAAYTAVDKAESEPELAALINHKGAEQLAIVAKNADIPLIHISTDYVFGGNSCHPLHEEQPTDPIGVYGATKLAGEQAIEASGCQGAIVRTSWLYSEFGNNFLKTMLRLGAEREQLQVVYDQVGTPTYAPDLAEALLKIAEQQMIGTTHYHYSNEGVTSWYDFAREIFLASGLCVALTPIESHLYPTAAKRPAYSVLSKDKIKTIGVTVPHWREALLRCLKALQP